MLKLICLGASPGLVCSSCPARGAGGYLMRFRVGAQVTPWRPPLQQSSQEAAPLQVGQGVRVLGGGAPRVGHPGSSLLLLCPILTSCL